MGIRSTFLDLRCIGEVGGRRIRIVMASDGSSVGAVLIAHAAERQSKLPSSIPGAQSPQGNSGSFNNLRWFRQDKIEIGKRSRLKLRIMSRY